MPVRTHVGQILRAERSSNSHTCFSSISDQAARFSNRVYCNHFSVFGPNLRVRLLGSVCTLSLPYVVLYMMETQWIPRLPAEPPLGSFPSCSQGPVRFLVNIFFGAPLVDASGSCGVHTCVTCALTQGGLHKSCGIALTVSTGRVDCYRWVVQWPMHSGFKGSE